MATIQWITSWLQTRRSWLLVGNNHISSHFHTVLDAQPWTGKQDVIFLESSSDSPEKRQGEILEKIYLHDVGYIVLDMQSEYGKKLVESLYHLLFDDKYFFDIAQIYGELSGAVLLDRFEAASLLKRSRDRGYENFKRLIDVVISLILLIILLPIALVILFFNPHTDGKVSCVGRDLERFAITNYKSKFLRAYTRFWSVFRGNFSFIGPLPVRETDYLKTNGSLAHDMRYLTKPGIISWKGRSNSLAQAVDDPLAFDLFYVQNHSFFFDMRTLFYFLREKLYISRNES